MSGRLALGHGRRLADRLPEPARQRLERLRRGESPSLHRAVTRKAPRGVTPHVVTEFDAHAVRACVAFSVRAALDDADVPYVLLPGAHGTVRQIAVAATDRSRALAALTESLTGPGWVVDPPPGRAASGVMTAYRVLCSPGGRVLCGPESGCEIGFWAAVSAGSRRSEGGEHQPGTRLAPSRNEVAAYLSAEAWATATAAPNHWLVSDPLPDPIEVTGPVDIVFTWVDGDDPAWQARRIAFDDPGDDSNYSAAHASRYTASRDELRYALRSVAMFAGWVRNIYLVTDDQVPKWLDTTHPKIHIVDHRDIFGDHSALPVFNSHAIEARLHRIEGLAEHYVYLNDDMFFGRPVDPELFYLGDGLEKVFLSKDTADLDPPTTRDLPAITAAKNGRELIERVFGVTTHRKYQHAAHPQLRSVLEDMQRREPDLFETVSRSRFRHPSDYSIPSSLQHSWALASGRAVPGHWDYAYQDIGRATTPRALDGILRRRPQSFCLNDMGTEEISPEVQAEALAGFFDEYFPLPAPWEIPGE